jgi:hypothetical protein
MLMKITKWIAIPLSIACMFFTMCIVYADQDDHANTCVEATPVDINSTNFGIIGTAGDHDVFRIDIPAPGASLTISTKSKTDLFGVLKDSNCNVLAENDDSGELFNFKIGPQILNEGSYYILVRHYSNFGQGDYELHVKSDPVIDFTYSTKVSWTEYKQTTRTVETSCRGTKWPECSSRNCRANGIIELPFEQEITLNAGQNSDRRCKDKKKQYKVDDGEMLDINGSTTVNVKQKVEMHVYGETCHNWDCCHEKCHVWINATILEKSADQEDVQENLKESIQINSVKVIKRIPVPKPLQNGVNKNLSYEATTQNPNVKLECREENDYIVIYASATTKKSAIAGLSDLSGLSVASNVMATNAMKPSINIISYPDYGNRLKNLHGVVQNVASSEYSVIVMIFTSMWKVKPYQSNPLTPIREDGSWSCDITTNSGDHLAAKIAAFVVPSDFQLELNEETFRNFPEEIVDASIANAIVSRSTDK